MNDAHLHLLVNHVSLFALLFGAISLAVSMKRKSVELRVFASFLFLVAGIFAFISYETGEGAEAVLKALGTAAEESFLEAHEQAAEWALRSGILVATLTLAMEWAVCKKPKWAKPLQWALLLFAIHGCTVFAATAWQGGLIRHAEIRSK